MAFPYPKPFPGPSATAAPALAPADAFFARLATQPDATHDAAYRALFSSLEDTGVWDKLDFLYIYAAADAATALTSLKGSYSGTAMNSIPFTANVGYGLTDTTATTHYLKSNFTPSTDGVNWAATSACCFAWYKDNRSADSRCFSATEASGSTFLYPRHTFADQIYGLINSAGTPSLNDDNSHSNVVGTVGLLSLNLIGTTMEFKVNTTSIRSVTTTTNQGPPSGPVSFFNSPGGTETSNNCIRAAGGGGGLTAQNISDLRTAISTYLAAI